MTLEPRTATGRKLIAIYGASLLDDVLGIEAEAGTLDEAWAAAEAALPEGWRLTRLGTGGGEWTASAEPSPSYKQVYSGTYGGGTMWLGKGASGPTPAAALQALAETLRAVPA